MVKNINIVNYRGFFYRTNNRGVRGVNWAANPALPKKIKECKHGICVTRPLLDRMRNGDHLNIKVYYISKKEKSPIYKGLFCILKERLSEWIETNGFYITKGCKEVLVVPIALWDVIEEGQKIRESPQLKLI